MMTFIVILSEAKDTQIPSREGEGGVLEYTHL